MWRVVLPVLLVHAGCEDGQLTIQNSPMVQDKAPELSISDMGEQVENRVHLSGLVWDDQLVMMLNMNLMSDRAGSLWQGNPNSDGSWEWTGELEPGHHMMTLRVVDREGHENQSEFEIDVRTNDSPSCQILEPSAGSYSMDQLVSFQADAADPDGDDIWLLWTSSIQGTLFEGEAWERMLNVPGEHRIMLTVTDEFDSPCTDEVLIQLY